MPADTVLGSTLHFGTRVEDLTTDVLLNIFYLVHLKFFGFEKDIHGCPSFFVLDYAA